MAQIRKSGYRKNTSKDGTRSPHVSEAVSKKMDIIAKHKDKTFTEVCEEAMEEYVRKYIDSLDLIERQELLEMLWSEV